MRDSFWQGEEDKNGQNIHVQPLKDSFFLNNNIIFRRRQTPRGSFSRGTKSGNVIEFNNNFVQPVKTAAKHLIVVKSVVRGLGNEVLQKQTIFNNSKGSFLILLILNSTFYFFFHYASILLPHQLTQLQFNLLPHPGLVSAPPRGRYRALWESLI